MEIPARPEGKTKKDDGKLAWWQLSLLGVGCIIGTGYFLGSGIGIKMTGPSILLSFLLAGAGTYVVFEALAKMYAQDPQEGSFRSYAKLAYGGWAGFTSGWVYWFSEMLISGSQLTALSILSRFWFPEVQLWIFAIIYAVLGIIVVVIGTKGFERAQSIFAVIKVAAILMFIILACCILFGLFGGSRGDFNVPTTVKDFLPGGMTGLWSSLIFGFYAFGGIEIMGILSVRLKEKRDAKRSGTIMLLILMSIYLISLAFATSLVAYDQFNLKESPFVMALENYSLPFFPHVFNGAIIIAGFSTMAASLFAVTSMVLTLSKDGDAPKFFLKKGPLKVPPFAMGLTCLGLITSIVLSFLMPNRVYEYITTAAGLMLLYNWFFVLVTFGKLVKASTGEQIKRFTGMGLILIAISGTLVHQSSRPGFYVSVLFVAVVVIAMWVKYAISKRKKG